MDKEYMEFTGNSKLKKSKIICMYVMQFNKGGVMNILIRIKIISVYSHNSILKRRL